jgi:hypothetical protein
MEANRTVRCQGMMVFKFFQDIHLAKRCYDMAAETNADATVPVALALMKLTLLFSKKYLQEVSAANCSPKWF